MFTWCLYVRKNPARPHCHCYHRTKRKTETKINSYNDSDSDKESRPLLGEKYSVAPSETSSTVVITPKLSWWQRGKQLVPFLRLFTPLVVFWAIFFQQNSTWVVQGRDMNCYIGKLHVPPGQYLEPYWGLHVEKLNPSIRTPL